MTTHHTTFRLLSLALVGISSGVATAARADTYAVGPTRTYRQLDELPTLHPGDVVEVDGGATYDAIRFDDSGTSASPIRVVGLRSASGARPILSGGTNTVELAGDHYVFEGFEVTGGSSRCVYHHADDITIRDTVVHDCPRQGILGADTDSGSLLLEHTEVYRTGDGTQSHQIYMTTDQIAHPGSVFRMQLCYVHDGNGGNGVKSRAERNEIYYNWIEGSVYHEIELIGPDPGGTPVAEDAHVEHSDVVGNVFVKDGGTWVARFGGDGTGQTNGRYRFVYNTVILDAGASGVFRLFDGIESLEAHNNVIFQVGSGSAQIVRDAEASWVGGTRRIAGENNFVVEGTGLRDLPPEWTGTIRGADPMFTSLTGHDLRPATSSVLVGMAASSPMPVPGHAFPSPEVTPRFLPPARALLAVGSALPRPSGLDVGAYENGSAVAMPDGGMSMCTPSCGARVCGDDGCGGSCGTCDAPLTCGADGACGCGGARTDCAGSCVDLGSSPDHCGACDTACSGTEVCSAGACGTECGAGLTPCARACVDLDTDALHCGACDVVCSGDATCIMGACAATVRPDGGGGGGGDGDGGGRARADGGMMGSGADGGCACRIAPSQRPHRASPYGALALVLLLTAGRVRSRAHARRRAGRR